MVVALTVAGLVPDARRRGWWAILLSVLGVAAVMLLQPMSSPPLYDGIGFPDEPYRWVQPPPGWGKTPAVTPASAKVTVEADGVVPTLKGLSAEQGAQVAFQIESGNLVVPKGTTSLEAEAVAGPNPPEPPPAGTLASNVYTLSVKADKAGPLTVAPGKTLIINMRSEKPSNEDVVLQMYAGGTWTQVATARVGNDIYAAELPALGQFALVRLPAGVKPTVNVQSNNGFATPAVPNGGSTTTESNNTILFISAGGMVLLLLGGLVLARKRMSAG
jgi:hypothetical protein